MYFSINLATRTYLDRRVVNRVGAALFILLLLLLAWNVYRIAWNSGELRRLRADIVSYETKLNSRPSGVSETEYTQMLESIKFYNEIIDRKTYNWMGLLEQLENATPDGIALSHVTPDRKSGDIKIEGRAKNFAHLKSYLDKLEDSKFFTSILLLSHTNIELGERTKGLQFSISCKAAQQ
jgi:type IV pilus assembly protein PilN